MEALHFRNPYGTHRARTMPATISSDRGASSSKPGPGGERVDYTVKGERGLRLRVTADKAGAITRIWSLLYTRMSDGKKCRLTLGEYPAMTLAEACRRAGRLRNEARDGKDPAAERREAKQALTFEGLAESWLERHAKLKKRSWREDARNLRLNVLPAIGRMKAEAVTKADVLRLLHAIADRGATTQANRNLALVRAIYNWGLDHDLVPHNPALRIPAPCEEIERKRVLSDREIARFWTGLTASRSTRPVQLALCLSLLTGVRINEIAQARKSEFDLALGLWLIPGRRPLPGDKREGGTKNKRDHALPLSALAISLLHEAFQLAGPSEWVFPGRRNQGHPLGEKVATRAWARSRQAMDLDDVRVHDFRRTFGTIAGSCGHDDFRIGLYLNHTTGRSEVTSIYNRCPYQTEKQQIADDVSACLLKIIGDSSSPRLDQKAKVVQAHACVAKVEMPAEA